MKPRLTQEQHTDLGRTLADILVELTTRSVQLTNAYPVAGPESLPARKLDTAIRAIEDARDALEKAVFAEHPETAEIRDYYPRPIQPPPYPPEAPFSGRLGDRLHEVYEDLIADQPRPYIKPVAEIAERNAEERRQAGEEAP